jgi:hypothetical protein
MDPLTEYCVVRRKAFRPGSSSSSADEMLPQLGVGEWFPARNRSAAHRRAEHLVTSNDRHALPWHLQRGHLDYLRAASSQRDAWPKY